MSGFLIAAVQSSSVASDVAGNVEHHCDLIRRAAEEHADLIVFPELSLTGYSVMPAAEQALSAFARQLEPLQRLVDEYGCVVLVGAPVAGSPRPFIGALAFQPEEPPTVYRKRFVTATEQQAFACGHEMCVIAHRNHRIVPAVCADISNPEHADDAAQHAATIYPAGVFMVPDDIDRAHRNVQRYAAKHQMVTVLSNYATDCGGYQTAGRSAICDAQGTLLAETPACGEAIVLGRYSGGEWSASLRVL